MAQACKAEDPPSILDPNGLKSLKEPKGSKGPQELQNWME